MDASNQFGAARMSVALLFPGQGNQTPGFLRRLPAVRAVRDILERSSNFLGYDVFTLDTEAAISSTMSIQLGLVIAGAAFWNFLSNEGIEPRAVGGMSVGAFAAAVACGAVTLEEALKLVKRRAELMQSTFQGCAEGMAVVQGLGLTDLEVVLRGTDLSIANFNSPTQFVVAGSVRLLESLVNQAIEAGASKVTILATSVASHIPQLAPESLELLALARQVPAKAPNKTMFSNRFARRITTAEGVREELALNMAHPVRWHDIMTAMGELGVTVVLESPPGHALAGLAAETIPDVRAFSAAEMRWDVLLLAARLDQPD